MIEKDVDMTPKLPEYNFKSTLKKEEANIYRRIGIVATLTVFIMIIIFLWGTTVINSVGTFLSSFNRKNITTTTQNEDFLVAPHLDVLPIATNSALLDIKGWAKPKQEIELTVNDVLIGKLPTKDDGTFSFESVKLREAANQIKAVSKDKDKKTSDAALATITFDKTPPKLEVSEPVNNLLIGSGINQVRAKGKTDSGTTVSVNDNQIILNTDYTFDTTITVQPGDNKVRITAFDAAGNQTTIERLVTSASPSP